MDKHVSTGWQPGDFAVCIKIGPWVSPETGNPVPNRKIRNGQFCTVEAVKQFPYGLYLFFKEDQTRVPGGGQVCYASDRFIKVTPEAEDALDRQVIRNSVLV